MATGIKLVFQKGSSSKFWGATLDGKKVTTGWGRIGTDGQTKTKAFASAAAARAEYGKLAAEKKRKGYVEEGPTPDQKVFLAAGHEHKDLAFLSEYGEISCAICLSEVKAVVVGKMPKKLPKGEERRLDAPQLQQSLLWPIAGKLKPGTKLAATKLLSLIVAAARKGPTAKIVKLAEATRTKMYELVVKPSAAIKKPIEKMGGDPNWIGKEQWPTCRSCKTPMMFLAQLRHPTKSKGMLYVFQCQSDPGNCEDWSAAGYANAVVVQPNKLAEAPIDPKKKRTCSKYDKAKDAAGEGRPDVWCTNMDHEFSVRREPSEDMRRLDQFKTEADRAIACAVYEEFRDRVHHGRAFFSKVGGYPVWVQDDEIPKCGKCKKPMTFVAQIDYANHPKADRNINFGDCGSSYVFLCKTHDTGKFLWQCF